MNELEQIIGYNFKNKALLKNALSHTSFVNEKKDGSASNERLEFLGDSILGMVTAHFLFTRYPNMPEGDMTKRRAELVCEKSLASVGREIKLGSFLLLGKGEELCGGRERPSIIADAVEALIAAMYMDGGKAKAREFIYERILTHAEDIPEIGSGDYKTALQERVQRTKGSKVEYVMLGESGPDHNKRFDAAVFVNDVKLGEGTGRSKKDAEQQAAKAALRSFKR